MGTRDITLDALAMEFVVTGTVGDDVPPSERRRVERVGRFIHWDEQLQRLWVGPDDRREQWREVPPIA